MTHSPIAEQSLIITQIPTLGGGVSLLVTFDNTLSLWTDRALIAKASPIMLVGADCNRFCARTLFEVLRLVPQGHCVYLFADPSAPMSYDAVMATVESIAPDQFQRLATSATEHQVGPLAIIRSSPPPPWLTDTHTGWSVLLPDGDADDLSDQVTKTRAAAKQAGVSCEFVLASTRGADAVSPAADVRFVHISAEDDALAARLNRLAEAAVHADLLYLRSSHIPTEDFFTAMQSWGFSYAIATPHLVDVNGERGADWLLMAGDATYPAPVGLLDYRAHSPLVTLGGGAVMLRRSLWLQHRWNQNLRGDNVLTEYVRRLQRVGCLPVVADAVVRTTDARPSLQQLPFDERRDCAFLPDAGPWHVTWMSDAAPWMMTPR